MDRIELGSLIKSMPSIKDGWYFKLELLVNIISGLDAIHQINLIHRDFHHGNILINYDLMPYISDLGLSQPVEYFQDSNNQKNEIFGVLPFIAPEVLRGKPYTQASDIYNFSMIMWEFTSGIPPFNVREYDFHLAESICKGERPKIIENTPQYYIDLMKKCWDQEPSRRPTASEIMYIIWNWYLNYGNYPMIGISSVLTLEGRKFHEKHHLRDNDENFKNDVIEFKKANEILEQKQANSLITSKIINIAKSHPQAYYTSRMIDFTSELNETLGLHGVIQNIEELDNAISK